MCEYGWGVLTSCLEHVNVKGSILGSYNMEHRAPNLTSPQTPGYNALALEDDVLREIADHIMTHMGPERGLSS